MERQNHLFGLRLWCPWAVYPLFLSAAKLPFDEKEQDGAAVKQVRSPRGKRGMQIMPLELFELQENVYLL